MQRHLTSNHEIERRIAALQASLDHLSPDEAREAVEEMEVLRATLRSPSHLNPETR
jgi:hypothetical protein